MTPLKRTPLFEWHVAHGARMVDFGGWQLPLYYAGILEEHRSTRERAALFDVSHMGEIEIRGKGALPFLQYILTRDLSALRPGQMKLALILNHSGGIKDDVTVYALDPNSYRLVTNASTKDKIVAWLFDLKEGSENNIEIEDISEETGKIDLQGPAAMEIMEALGIGVRDLPYYHFLETRVSSLPVLVSRSGYTGEDGFEVYVSARETQALWEKMLEVGKNFGLLPAGLGARDTLRLEAGMMLYGNELNEAVNPFEVVYAWAVDLGKDFLGKEALLEIRKTGVARKLIGFVVEGKGIARHGYAVLREGIKVGEVTSGTYSPTLERAIGMAFVPEALGREGERIEIDVRGNVVPARVVRLPFYGRKKR